MATGRKVTLTLTDAAVANLERLRDGTPLTMSGIVCGMAEVLTRDDLARMVAGRWPRETQQADLGTEPPADSGERQRSLTTRPAPAAAPPSSDPPGGVG